MGDRDQKVSKSGFIRFLELDQFTPLFTTNYFKLRRSQKQYIRRKQVICWPGYKSEDDFATHNKITTNPYCTISPCKLGRKSAHIYYNILYPHNPYLVKSPKDPKNQLNDTCFASMDNFPLKRSCNWQANFISRQNTTIYHLFKDTAFNYNMILYFLLTGLSWWIPHLCTSQFTPEKEIYSYLAREVVNIDIGMPAMCFVIRSTCKDWYSLKNLTSYDGFSNIENFSLNLWQCLHQNPF